MQKITTYVKWYFLKLFSYSDAIKKQDGSDNFYLTILYNGIFKCVIDVALSTMKTAVSYQYSSRCGIWTEKFPVKKNKNGKPITVDRHLSEYYHLLFTRQTVLKGLGMDSISSVD